MYEKTLASQQIAPPHITTDTTHATPLKVRQIHQKAKTRYENEARRELLGEGMYYVHFNTKYYTECIKKLTVGKYSLN